MFRGDSPVYIQSPMEGMEDILTSQVIRRRFPSGVWSEREHCTLWKQNPQHKYCFEGRSNTTSNSQLEDHNILEKILFLMEATNDDLQGVMSD
ncbi:hypothetical protein YC2023_085212 [Brassica napus]